MGERSTVKPLCILSGFPSSAPRRTLPGRCQLVDQGHAQAGRARLKRAGQPQADLREAVVCACSDDGHYLATTHRIPTLKASASAHQEMRTSP